MKKELIKLTLLKTLTLHNFTRGGVEIPYNYLIFKHVKYINDT